MPEPVTTEWLAEVRGRFEPYRQAITEPFAAMENPDDPAHEGAGLLVTLHAANDIANDVPALIDAVERLMPAQYTSGPEGCCNGDFECDEYHDADGGFNDVRWCSHVTHKVATFADVKRREYLEDLVTILRETAEHAHGGEPGYDLAAHVVELIDCGLEAMEADDDA